MHVRIGKVNQLHYFTFLRLYPFAYYMFLKLFRVCVYVRSVCVHVYVSLLNRFTVFIHINSKHFYRA